MFDKPISPLRQRMIDDMTARRFTEDTQRDYVRNVRNFAAFLGRSPDTATKEDLRPRGAAPGLALSRPEPDQPGTAPSPSPRLWRESPSACRRTPCGTASPRICSSRRRHSCDPGVARNGYIVPTNSRLKLVSATGSTRASAKGCRSGDGSKAAAASSSSFFNRTARSPACRHG